MSASGGDRRDGAQPERMARWLMSPRRDRVMDERKVEGSPHVDSEATDVADRLRSMADAGSALDAALTESRTLLSRHAAICLGTPPERWP
jgi:hypothetical protein